AGGNDERRESEDDAQIRELLEHVVAARRHSRGMAEAQMIEERSRDAAQVCPRGPEIVGQVPPREGPEAEAEPGQDEDPGEEEMPAPSHGQPLIARQGCPRWKPALLEVGPATARGSQQSRRVELPTEDLRDATDLALRGLHRLQSEQRPVGVRPLTPVEGRVGVEDLQSAHHEDEETEGGQPVAEPGGQRMAIDAALREDHDVLIRYTMQAVRCAEIDSPSIGPHHVRMPGAVTDPHVVIVGGGFGGLHAARALAGRPVRVTLLDRRNHHLFQPLLYQVATAALNAADIATPLRSILRRAINVTVLLADVEKVDLAAR